MASRCRRYSNISWIKGIVSIWQVIHLFSFSWRYGGGLDGHTEAHLLLAGIGQCRATSVGVW